MPVLPSLPFFSRFSLACFPPSPFPLSLYTTVPLVPPFIPLPSPSFIPSLFLSLSPTSLVLASISLHYGPFLRIIAVLSPLPPGSYSPASLIHPSPSLLPPPSDSLVSLSFSTSSSSPFVIPPLPFPPSLPSSLHLPSPHSSPSVFSSCLGTSSPPSPLSSPSASSHLLLDTDMQTHPPHTPPRRIVMQTQERDLVNAYDRGRAGWHPVIPERDDWMVGADGGRVCVEVQ
ncbi:hypothetical protein B0H10DRAFT_2237155 [Mycena sp. CBHHK59/15]|nr:hypothetical protein B0H10DRAFT_2237155 [Mycena sp. CBHHK59/15]